MHSLSAQLDVPCKSKHTTCGQLVNDGWQAHSCHRGACDHLTDSQQHEVLSLSPVLARNICCCVGAQHISVSMWVCCHRCFWVRITMWCLVGAKMVASLHHLEAACPVHLFLFLEEGPWLGAPHSPPPFDDIKGGVNLCTSCQDCMQVIQTGKFSYCVCFRLPCLGPTIYWDIMVLTRLEHSHSQLSKPPCGVWDSCE